MVFKPVGIDENSRFPERVEARLAAQFSGGGGGGGANLSEQGAWTANVAYAAGAVVTYQGTRWATPIARAASATFVQSQWVSLGAAVESAVELGRDASGQVYLVRTPTQVTDTAADESVLVNKTALALAIESLSDKSDRTPTVRTVSAAYTLAATEASLDTVLNVTAATPVTVTIPLNFAIPAEVELKWRQYGAGAVTFVPATGVTLLALNNATTSAGRYSNGILTRVATNTFVLHGDLTGTGGTTTTAPGAPATASAVTGQESATVSWTAPASDGGSPILGYTITYTGGSVTATATARSIIITGLNSGQAYTFSITARNGVGTGPAATTNSVTPTAGVVVTPTTGEFWEMPTYTVPAGATYYSGSGSLGTAMAAVPTNGWLILDYTGTKTEDINIPLRDGVRIYAAAGKRPRLDGLCRISAGNLTRIWGLDVANSSPAIDDHVVKLDGGSPDWGYSRCWLPGPGCYTIMRPGQTARDWRIHHSWIYNNPGVSSHDGNQDHGFYCSGTVSGANGLIDHCFIDNTPRGRGIKIGGSSSSNPATGDIEVRHCTVRKNYGPSNIQTSYGAVNCNVHHNILIDSGRDTSLTTGPGSGGGNVYHDNKSDRVAGDDTSQFNDTGGNVNNVSVATLQDFAAQGRAGFGHLAP
jgi:hypothetical protein